jgi:hypothetical protein
MNGLLNPVFISQLMQHQQLDGVQQLHPTAFASVRYDDGLEHMQWWIGVVLALSHQAAYQLLLHWTHTCVF